jgi:Xaa-Pro aminopeptidase
MDIRIQKLTEANRVVSFSFGEVTVDADGIAVVSSDYMRVIEQLGWTFLGNAETAPLSEEEQKAADEAAAAEAEISKANAKAAKVAMSAMKEALEVRTVKELKVIAAALNETSLPDSKADIVGFLAVSMIRANKTPEDVALMVEA